MSLNNLYLLPVLLVVIPLLTLAQADETADRNEICGDIKSNVKDIASEFSFEPQFKVHVEAVMPEMGRIANSWMEFSTSKKMLKATLKSNKWDYAIYEDYEHHQTLIYDFLSGGRGSCKVDPAMGERLGFYLVPDPPEAGKSPAVTDVLRLTGKSGFGSENIILRKTVTKNQKFRSLKVIQYDSCQKIKTSDNSEAIVKVTHLVSNTKLARTESGTVPVQIVFKGKFVSGPKAKDKDGNLKKTPIEHTYNFFHYTTSVGDDDFQTPVGIVCENRKGPSSFPKPPLYIQFGQEVHDSSTSLLFTLRTIYDKEFNFVTEEFFDPKPGRQAVNRFDDFYAGISYNIDHNTGACFATNISQMTMVNDFVKTKDGKIQMMTPEQFWNIEGVEYHYNGKKHFRGLETEAWIGQDANTGFTYEWYFTFGIQHSMNDDAKSEKSDPHRIPYKRMFWPDNTDKHFSNYYFQVDLTEPPLLIDLSPCYINKKFISLFVAGLTLERVEKDETLVLRRAVTTLTKQLSVPFTRISQPQIAFKGDKGYILFDLLGPPKYSSDLITQHTNQPSLDEVVSTLKKLTDDRSLVFEVGNKEIFVKGEATYEEFAFSSPEGAGGGYSAGALAGLSLAMVVVGLAAGGGGGYWFFIRH